MYVVIIYVCTVARVHVFPLIYDYYNALYGAELRFRAQNHYFLNQFIDLNSIVLYSIVYRIIINILMYSVLYFLVLPGSWSPHQNVNDSRYLLMYPQGTLINHKRIKYSS